MNETIELFLRQPVTALISRIVLTLPFWASGLMKLINFDAGAVEMARAGLEPANGFNIATIGVQLAGSLLIILGRHVWLGAGALGVFTGLTILLVHDFWTMTEEPLRTIAFHTAIARVGEASCLQDGPGQAIGSIELAVPGIGVRLQHP